MSLRLEITSEHREFLGDDRIHTFRENGGTIGRSLQNDWILPDADKYISGNHATIDYKGGAFYLADISTNGVYVNDSEEPLGRSRPYRLFDGDRLRMGDFEMVVRLDEGEDLELPPEPPATVVPDHIEQLVPEDDIRSSMMLLDEEELTGDDEFQAALFGTGPRPKGKLIDPQPTNRAPAEPERAPVKSASPPSQPTDNEDLLNSFLRAAGVSRADVHPAVDPHDVMKNAGKVLKAFVHGTGDLLTARTRVKSMFRLDQTTVMPRHNNPLKLSTNGTEALKQLLLGKEGEYLSPEDSVTEACRDLKFHHDAVMAALSKSFADFIDRMDPEELQEAFDKALERKPIFAALNQLKYWRLYSDLYPIVTQKGAAALPQQLAEEFVRQYDRQIADYTRMDSGFRDTQVLDHSASVEAAANDALDPLGDADSGSFREGSER